ncbi:hypothetical protein ACWEOE_28860 [Amycolatopsis sp. NPDC004368]
MTALGDHAIAELDHEGITDPVRAAIVMIVGTYADLTDANIETAKGIVELLLQFKALSPLTNDPGEWQARTDIVSGQEVWQSKRWPDAWTYDSSFRGYFLMSEHNGDGTPNTHNTVIPEG